MGWLQNLKVELIGTKVLTLKRSPSKIWGLKHKSGKQFLFQLNNKLINDLPNALSVARASGHVIND